MPISSRSKQRRGIYKHPKDKLLIRNVDDVVDALMSGTSNGVVQIDTLPGYTSAFPRDNGKRFCGLDGFFRSIKHVARRMRAAWHPDARSYVYAYAYDFHSIDELSDEEYEEYDSIFLNNSASKRGSDDWKLVKVGTSTDYKERQKSHLRELSKILSKMSLGYGLDCLLLVLPCLRAAAGEYLESYVLDSLSKEDHFNGEWYHDTNGVSKVLSAWFVAAHTCYKEDTLPK